MKILINTRDLSYKGGVVNYFRILSLYRLPENNIEYFVFSKPDVRNKAWFLLKSYFLFFKKIKNADIVQVNPSLVKTAVWRDLVFLMLAKFRHKRAIVFFRGWDNSLAQKIMNNKVMLFFFLHYNKADAFFVLGDIFKQKLIDLGINKDKKFFIETTIADDRYIQDFNLDEKIQQFENKENAIRFLFISRITTGKGMQLAIDIFNKVQLNHKRKMELIIAGDGDKLEETKRYVQQYQVENVVFAGYVKNEIKHELLKKSNILILTSESEGLPNSVLEGMLYGMPIITTDVGSIASWVKNEENGFITSSTHPDDFVPFIEKLLSDYHLYAQMARNNHKVAKENFTKEVITKRLLEHYKEVYNAN